MKSIRTRFAHARFIMTFLLLCSFIISNQVFAEGTPQVSPTNSANGAALLSAPDLGSGPYRNAPNENRLRFTINNNATENLYFGLMPRTYNNNGTALRTDVYYRIYNNANVLVAGPTLVPNTGAGFISTYAQATAGPNIGGATPTGYTPFVFNPTADGDYYVEIYASSDGGATGATGTAARVTCPLFDFTVSTAANVQSPGRIWSREWGFVVVDLVSGNFDNALTSSFTGDFYAYTPEQFTLRVNFAPGFKPVAYQMAMNFTGVGNTGNFINDRQSVNSNISIPSITNGYQVFLLNPDGSVFPDGTVGSPGFTSSVYGCPGNYFIPYYITEPGDISFLLDLNGTPGFQAGTADRIIEIYGATAGNNVLQWDGTDGLGAAVTSLINLQVTLVLYQGRTNLPMIDAELNSNGLSVTGIFPATGNRRLYWDDTQVSTFGTCGTITSQPDNITTGGIEISALSAGVFGPSHAYDGSNPTTVVPAPVGGEGSSTPGALCDDFGNNRVINTWFYASELTTSNVAMVTPDCDKDGDGFDNDIDLDDDNDGILDVTEHLGMPDPMADADGDNIPNFIDWDAPGFVDSNFDGVDDNYDTDLDGIIDGCDLDSDGDGIPDNIEAQSTTGYIAPLGTYTNGVDNAYLGGLTPENTDGDSEPDYLDLDSDNEGGDDTAEAGITLAGNDADLDGLDDATDATSDYTDQNGIYDNTQDDNFPDADADVNAGGDVDWRDSTFNDHDDDGVADLIDLDDDNDGILDVTENGGFPEPLADADGDGILNYLDPSSPGFVDTNGDGVDDRYDSDLDGVINQFDLDSDNDGIYDVTEAGGLDTDGNGTADDDDDNADNTGSNGIPTSAGAGTTPLDFGNNGTPNYLNLDSDEDGCDDVTEAGFTDQNSDGVLGTTPLIVNADGVVTGTTVSDGYTGTNVNVTTPGTPGSISSQPVNASVGISNDTTFTVTAAGSDLVYQWQISTNGGGSWTNLSNSGTNPQYSGVNSSTLSVDNIPFTSNNNQFRVLITSTSYLCTDLTSSPGVLSVDPGANVGISKTVNNATPTVGSNVIFTLVANNAGPSTAAAVTVNDVLPAGYTFVSASPLGVYNDVTGDWNVGSLTNGGSSTLTITATVNASGPYQNCAAISIGTQTDPVVANNFSCVSTVPVPQADLSITKVALPTTPLVGGNVTFTITATNGGLSNVPSVSVSDVLPSGYNLVSATPSTGSFSGGVWNGFSLNGTSPGNTATLTIVASVLASGSYANTATISGGSVSDPDLTNNSSTATPVPTAQADLAVTKIVDNATPFVGDTVTFTIGASNGGLSTAIGAIATDILPTGYTFISSTETIGTYDDVSGIWNIGDMTNGASETLTIVASVNASGSYVNSVSIASPTTDDPTSGNDTATATTVPVAQSDISVTKGASSLTPDVGSIITFDINVTNNGPSPATGVAVTDLLPNCYAFLSYTTSANASGIAYNDANGAWNIGSMPNGATYSLYIQAVVQASGNCTNEVSVISDNDPNTVNDTASVSPDPVPQTNLGVIKTATPTNPNVGGTVVFTIIVDNAGPSDATGVVLTDLLPNGYTISTVAPPVVSTGAYNPVNGEWDIDGLPKDSTEIMTITATVNASGDYANTATVTGDENDPTPGNNTSTVIPGPTPQANLSITKTANTSSPDVGGTITFTLTAANSGPSDATGVVVNDLLPTGYTYITHATSFGNYDDATGVWNGFDLANGAIATILISASVDTSGIYENCANISATQNDPSNGNDTSCVTPTPVPDADLSVLKTVNDATPNVGDTVTFTIVATNDGPNVAAGAQVSDVLPAGYLFISEGSPIGNYSGGVWSIGDLADQASATLTIQAQVLGSGPYANTADISSNLNDTDPTNNSSTATTVPVPVSDLAIAKTVDDATPNVGSIVTFTLTVTNNGLSPATGVVVNDLLQSCYTFNGASSADYSQFTGDWLVGPLASGSSESLTITATVNASGNCDNTATVDGNEIDPDPSNDTVTISTVPVPQANVGITKTVTPNNPTVGSNVIFTLTVTNAGPSDATGVVVDDTLPSGYTYVPSVPGTGTFDPVTNVWSIGPLANGATAIFNMEATVNVSGEYTNCASVEAIEGDPSTSNNTACASPVPSALANLVVNKSVNISSPPVGSQVIFTINATNVGPSDATDVIVNDPLPSGYILDSAVTATGTYTAPDWDIDNLANNATVTLLIYATVNPSGAYANTAIISGGQTDPNTSNNTSTAITTPIPQTDLWVEKTVSAGTPNVEDTVVFTIVAGNYGPNNASGVLVQDQLPSGYNFVSATGGTYVAPNWLIGVLNSGITDTLTITAVVLPTGNYANTGIISGNQIDPNLSNNDSTATPVPVQLSNLSIVKTVGPPSPQVGIDDVTFTLTVTNNGPNVATGVVVNDTLPSGYIYQSSNGTGSYDPATNLWTIGGNLPNGASVSMDIVASVLATGTYINTATVAGDQVDPDLSDNISSIAPTPVPVSDLSIEKTVSPNSTTVGDTIVFTVVATNNGPSPALGVSVTDTIPDGYSIVSSSTTSGTYSSSTGDWNISSMPFPGTDTLTVQVVVLASGSYINVASITGTNVDPNSSNNIATATPGVLNTPPVAVDDSITVLEDTPTNPTQIVTTNDSDIDGNLDVSTVDLNTTAAGTQNVGTTAAGGNVTVDLAGNIIYTPPLNFNGLDSITYTVSDDSAAVSNIATIFFNVGLVNDPPIVISETITIFEDSLGTGNILTLTGDNDPDGTTLVVDSVPVLDPSNGTIVIDTLGNFIYTPDSNFFGIDTVVFEVCDSGLPLPALCVNDTLFINVIFVNDPPVAIDDDTTTLEDTPVTIDLLANDYDPDGFLLPQTLDLDTITSNGVQDTIVNIYGTWITDGNGNLTYTPAPDFNGTATIQYTVCDTSLLVSNIATVTIIVIPVNDTVSQGNETASINEDELTPIVVDLTDNNIDPDTTLVTISTIDLITNGGTVVILPGDTTISYVPAPGFNGVDTVIYTVCDSGTPAPPICVQDTLFVNVLPTNDAPDAVDDIVAAPLVEDGANGVVDILNNDTDPDGNPTAPTNGPGQFTVDLDPSTPGNQTTYTDPTGTWTYDPTTGVVIFDPSVNYYGTATIPYVLCDTDGACDTANITFTVIPANDGPTTTSVDVSTPIDVPVPVNVGAGTTDPENNPITYTYDTTGIPGTIVVTGNGAIVFTPDSGFIGTVTIPFFACDSSLFAVTSLCDSADIVINVIDTTGPGNNGPIANTDLVTVPVGDTATVNPLGNDFDVDGDSLVVAITPGNEITPNGVYNVNPDGTITFIPNDPNFVGMDSVEYVICDTGSPVLCDSAYIIVTISPVVDTPNVAPIAVDDYATTTEDTPVDVVIAGNDTDPNGDPLGTPTIIDNGNDGTATIDPATGILTYDPDPNFIGTDTVTYVICDTGNPVLCDTADVVITVVPGNDAPTTSPVTVVTPLGTPVPVNVGAGTTDPENNPLTYTYDLTDPSIPAGTTVVPTGNGAIVVTPPAGFGPGTFTIPFTVCDSSAFAVNVLCDTDTIYVVVVDTAGPGNNPPVANNDQVTVPVGQTPTVNVLGNDSDVDGDSLTVTVTPTGNNGTFTDNGDGTVTYTPNDPTWTGTDTTDYVICDNGIPVLCDTAQIIVTISPVVDTPNVAPIAVDDYATTDEDTQITIDVLVNDSDPNGNPISFPSILDSTDNGTISVDTNGDLVYTPDPNFNGMDTLTYVICDFGTPVLCDTAQVIITVLPINDTPLVDNEYDTIPLLGTVNGDVTDPLGTVDDQDIDGNLIVNTTPLSGPSSGTIIINPDGTYTYTDTSGTPGNDTIIVEICDDGTPLPAICINDTIFINVLPNVAPTVVNANAATSEDICINLDVLNGSSDPDGTVDSTTVDLDPITPGIQDTLITAGGTWIVNAAGIVEFCPIPDSCGYTATANFTVNDDLGSTSNVGTISIFVVCVNDAPIADTAVLTTLEDTPISVGLDTLTSDIDGFIDLTTIDLDPISSSIEDTIINSDGQWVVLPTGVLTFTPTADSCDYIAVLDYVVTDNGGLISNLGQISVYVQCVNDAPNTDTVNVATPIGTPVGVNVAAGTSDPENNPITYTYDTLGIPGTVVITGNGAIVFTPNPGFVGTVTIPFTACDSSIYSVNVLCDSAAIVINVVDTTLPGNNDPIANNDLITSPIGTPSTVNPLANDYDVDGDPLDVTFTNTPGSTSTTTPNGGTATVNPDGTITYVPDPTFTGIDSIPYSICDTATPPGCDTAFIIITISPVVDTNNLAPIATDDFGTTPEDSTIVIDIIVNDSDPNGTPLDTATIFSGPFNGTASIDPNGDLVYTPNTGFIGLDTVVYVICDTNGLPYCDTATVIINVTPGNAPPTTTDVTVVTSVDTPIGVNVAAGTSDPENNPLTYTYDLTDPSIPIGTVVDSTGTGTISVTPPSGYTGTFTIPFVVCDSSFFPVNVLCDSGVITVIVVDTTGGTNNDPVANNDLLTTPIGVPVIVNPIGNDFDPDGDSLIVTFTNTPGSTTTTTPNGGTATVNPDGTISYIPDPNFVGIDSIPYSICDTATPPGCDTAFIIITVSPVVDTNNVAPAAADDYASTIINVPVTFPVMNNDIDPNGDSLSNPTVNITTNGSNGDGTVNTDGTITYVPDPGFVGIDTVTYVICDNGVPVLCDTALYIITIILPNQNPAQGNEFLSVSQCDSLMSIDVLANNIDPDADSVLVSTFTATSTAGGTVTLNGDGTLNYVPLMNYVGLDTVFYTVCDTFVPAGCVNDTLIIDVLPDNDCDGIANNDDIDDDNDGITDLDECATAGGVPGACDTDGDGIIDQYDLDSDNDGILDIVESGGGQWDTDGDGVIDSNVDTDNNGLMDVADPGVAGGIANPNPDTDGDGRPDFQDLDSDGDGIPDIFESGADALDADGDGIIDDLTDTDNDGIADVADANNGGTANPNPDTDGDGLADNIDLDADNDGISDVLESGQPDVDGDGMIDAPANADANNDGLADTQVGQNPQDFDNDTYPDYVDLDSDSDGIPDVIENGYADTDADGVVDNFTDANNNGWDDSSEGSPLVNSDTDPLPDYHDHDSDQDGIPDVVEGGQDDVDMDGWLDDLTDTDGNGWADNYEGAPIFDWDADGIYDYLDDDSDGDGILDVIEGGFVDADNDGVIDNFTDPDNDGWDINGMGWTIPDTDGDGIPDFRDLDSDGDGIPDGPDDNYNQDCDNDGVPDWLDPDPCETVLEIPEGFTPNGDGSNDFFVIPGIDQFEGNVLMIYNRWGNVVFDAVDYDNQWQGTTNNSMAVGGDLLPTGTYYYVLDTKDPTVGEDGVLTGFIYIQR